MKRLPKDHPNVVNLLHRAQSQLENTEKLPQAIVVINIEYLKTELYKRGWKTALADDERTVVLLPVPVEEEAVNKRSFHLIKADSAIISLFKNIGRLL